MMNLCEQIMNQVVHVIYFLRNKLACSEYLRIDMGAQRWPW